MECVALSSRCCHALASIPLARQISARNAARPISVRLHRSAGLLAPRKGLLQVLVHQSRYGSSSCSQRKSIAALAEEEGTNAGPWSVRNDYDKDYVLVSEDAEELEREIQKVEQENQLLRSRLEEVDKFAKETVEGRKDKIDVDHPRLDARPPQGSAEHSETSAQAVATPSSSQQSSVPAASASGDSEKHEQNLENATLARLQQNDKQPKAEKPISIVFVTSEVAPYSKTGGLADVIGSLPPALAARGHRVMVVSPRYMNGVTDHLYKGAFDCDTRIQIGCFGSSHEVAFFHEFKDGVDWVFVDHPAYHRPGNPYGDTRGAFGDNQFRFTLLSLAACEAPLVLPLGGFTYGEKVLFVANDWHASLVPVYVAAKYRPFGVYKDARTILAIHNLSHQGVEPGVTFGNLNLPPEWYGALEWVFPEWARKHAFDKGEAVNHMKGAIVTSDRLLTVSQGYAWEITTPEGGWGMDGLLRSRQSVLNGITNGVDINDWNPATDNNIPSQYTVDDQAGKVRHTSVRTPLARRGLDGRVVSSKRHRGVLCWQWPSSKYGKWSPRNQPEKMLRRLEMVLANAGGLFNVGHKRRRT